MQRESFAEDRVADLRQRWTPEATAAAVAFLESRPTNFDLPTMEHGGRTFLDLRGLRIEQTQIDKAFLRNVNLRWAVFKDVGFKNARFVGCNLSQVTFAECYLRRAQFEKCDLVSARFESCDFSQAKITDSRIDFAGFKNCEVGLQNIDFQKDATPRAMVRVCRGLKLNAMSMGNFADAGELTYLEKTYERIGYWRERAWGRWLSSALQDWIWGYGEKPWRLAVVMVANIVMFGSILYAVDGLAAGKTYWEYVYFSGITYLTVGYGDLAPDTPLARFISVVNAGTGIASLGMLIASITKKVMYR
ncbi:MAG TPA: pentapeptide repeat-containing protein [Burkholderiales bacterium]|nr:pentapeptide repeat-containing protein [Burkholderiales bacterium]